MKILLLLPLVLAMLFTAAQVKPIVSDDYLKLIRQNSQAGKGLIDTSNSISFSPVSTTISYNGVRVAKIGIRHNQLQWKAAKSEILSLNGSVSNIVEVRKTGPLPGLQNEYVQGRSENGKLIWQGPETNELFSYGPHIGSLEFDGNPYLYDAGGNLVDKGSGNGQPAVSYNNSLFRTGFFSSQHISLQGIYKKDYKEILSGSLNTGQSSERSFIPHVRNQTNNVAASLRAPTKWGTLIGNARWQSKDFAVNNRNGFLNRVYQNALLTPSSFLNKQGTITPTGQRSYSRFADNPVFLLEDNSNAYWQQQKVFSLALQNYKWPFSYSLNQSFEQVEENSNEGYKKGTAFFENGINVLRHKVDRNYFSRANAEHRIDYNIYDLKSVANANYVLSATQSNITYQPGKIFQYSRVAHDAAFSYTTTYRKKDWETGLKLENKFYASTTTKPDFFLPAINASIEFSRLFDNRLIAKLSGGVNHFNSELPITQSYAVANLLLLHSMNTSQFFPLNEVESFDGLKPVRNREVSVKADLSYKYKLRLTAEWFERTTRDDVFPIFENNKLALQNIATHRNRGFELELSFSQQKKKLSWSSSLSFFSYRSKVTYVTEGYNNTAIAGFSNIHKTIVEGHPLGAITGKALMKNAEGKIIIGNDGFPASEAYPKIIGDPNPDFSLKLWNNLSYKNLSMNISWEWKRGGDVWNGTAAVLDYYGRSQKTGEQRNITGYVFNGVTESGHVNTTPVSFYDPSQPVKHNRWVRNGFGGIDEEYIQDGSYIRINNLSFSYKIITKKYLQNILLSAYTNNLLVWTRYEGGDPSQLLYDQPNSYGLDFFNLPSLKQFGFSITLQF